MAGKNLPSGPFDALKLLARIAQRSHYANPLIMEQEGQED